MGGSHVSQPLSTMHCSRTAASPRARRSAATKALAAGSSTLPSGSSKAMEPLRPWPEKLTMSGWCLESAWLGIVGLGWG